MSMKTYITNWLKTNDGTRKQRLNVAKSQLYPEGANTTSTIINFTLLMVLSSGIAIMGVLGDSTAVVIGAMLVAPLISPILGIGLAIVMGWEDRLARSSAMTLWGILITIVMGLFFVWVLPLNVDPVTNSQIASRVSPTIVDVFIAVFAGACGSMAVARKDFSNAVPGVAIAIALVPPLAVVGITLGLGQWTLAAGAMLLFLTNLVAIIIVGGLTFVLTGLVPFKTASQAQHRVRTALFSVGALSVLVAGGLIFNGLSIAQDAYDNQTASSAVSQWLGESSDFRVDNLEVQGKAITVEISGPGAPPSEQSLAEVLAKELNRPVNLELQWTVRERRFQSAVVPQNS